MARGAGELNSPLASIVLASVSGLGLKCGLLENVVWASNKGNISFYGFCE